MKDYDFTYELIEKILVKRSLTDKKYMEIMSRIFDMRWFDKNPNMGVVLNLAIKYYKNYGKLPTNKILQMILSKYASSNGANEAELTSCLMEISKLDMAVNDECASKNLEKYINEKGFYFAVSDNIAEITKNGNIDKCLERFYKIQKISFLDDDLGMNYFDTADMDKHWDGILNPESKISTGWDGLDRHTNGGFYRDGRMVACFMGQPGLGKSLFLSNVTTNLLKQGKSVVVISLEMSQDVYAMRFDAHISGKNINRLRYCADEARKNILKFYNDHKTANLIIKEYPPRTVKTTDIEIYLDKLTENGIKFDALVIDYLNLVLPPDKSDTMYEGVLSVTEKLRALSYKFNVPVITATQASSSGMNTEKIGMEHVSESRGIAHTVDFLGGLYSVDEQDIENGIINMKILKNRLGGNVGSVIKFKKDPYSLTLTDMTFSNETESENEVDRITNSITSISSDLNSDDL